MTCPSPRRWPQASSALRGCPGIRRNPDLRHDGFRYITEPVIQMKKQDALHPGIVLFEQFLKPSGLSQNALAREIGVPPRRINEIILGKRGITADTALRLAKRFGNSARFWMGLQADFDLDEARKSLASS